MVILVIIVIMVIPFDASDYKRYPSGEGFQRLVNCNGQEGFSCWRWSDLRMEIGELEKRLSSGFQRSPSVGRILRLIKICENESEVP